MPYIRHPESARTIMGDVIIALAPLYFMACFYYGYRILLVGATAVLSCLLADWLCSYLLHGLRVAAVHIRKAREQALIAFAEVSAQVPELL